MISHKFVKILGSLAKEEATSNSIGCCFIELNNQYHFEPNNSKPLVLIMK